mmetsp:Transcript_25887/g.65263  ORF Transcript_25887/g.65263 Transcript_25887/m.65263 type:complete len:226 (+) Transcript_25887:641-1318(+)
MPFPCSTSAYRDRNTPRSSASFASACGLDTKFWLQTRAKQYNTMEMVRAESVFKTEEFALPLCGPVAPLAAAVVCEVGEDFAISSLSLRMQFFSAVDGSNICRFWYGTSRRCTLMTAYSAFTTSAVDFDFMFCVSPISSGFSRYFSSTNSGPLAALSAALFLICIRAVGFTLFATLANPFRLGAPLPLPDAVPSPTECMSPPLPLCPRSMSWMMSIVSGLVNRIE